MPGAMVVIDISGALFSMILAAVMVLAVLYPILNRVYKKNTSAEKMTSKYQVLGMITLCFIGIYGGFVKAGVGFTIYGGAFNDQ
jgi:uncharacterized protein